MLITALPTIVFAFVVFTDMMSAVSAAIPARSFRLLKNGKS